MTRLVGVGTRPTPDIAKPLNVYPVEVATFLNRQKGNDEELTSKFGGDRGLSHDNPYNVVGRFSANQFCLWPCLYQRLYYCRRNRRRSPREGSDFPAPHPRSRCGESDSCFFSSSPLSPNKGINGLQPRPQQRKRSRTYSSLPDHRQRATGPNRKAQRQPTHNHIYRRPQR